MEGRLRRGRVEKVLLTKGGQSPQVGPGVAPLLGSPHCEGHQAGSAKTPEHLVDYGEKRERERERNEERKTEECELSTLLQSGVQYSSYLTKYYA